MARINRNKALFTVLLFSSLAGTYLDLYFVGRGLYSFPHRPWPEIFSIHIGFTLLALPVVTALFLYISRNKHVFIIGGLILFASSVGAVFEKLAEEYGFFVHAPEWKHIYSFFGYIIFLTAITLLYSFLRDDK